MKKVLVFIVILICVANSCCFAKKAEQTTEQTTTEQITTEQITAAGIEMKNIEGHYINDEDMHTAIELIITKDDNGYKYQMTTPNRSLEGKIRFTDNPECFALGGIRWASWEIDGEPQELPEEVDVYIDESGGLSIQNYGGSSMGNNSYLIFDDIEEKYITLIKKYVTLPGGAIVDARIPKDDVDRIFKRFEAIENGDIASFRSTLGEMQDGVDYYYQLRLIFTFFGDFFDIDPDDFDEAVAYGGEELTEIAQTLFNGEHPLQSRNTGLSIKRLEYNGGLKVTATNNKNEEIIYDFLYY